MRIILYGVLISLLSTGCSSSVTDEEKAVYAKIIIPVDKRADSKIEPWIVKGLKEQGLTAFESATDWVLITDQKTAVWDTRFRGKHLGCPVAGSFEESNGRISVEMTGWSPVGAKISGNELNSHLGSRCIAVVDSGRADKVKYFVALKVVTKPKTKQ